MKLINKYRILLLAAIATLLFAVTLKSIFDPNPIPAINNFQSAFLEKEKALDRFLENQDDLLTHNTDYGNWKNYKAENEPFLHIYRNDSLIYWNTTQLPVIQFADVHFPVNGIVHLQNGWYYTKTVKRDNYIIAASFLIRNEYPYENDALSNDFESSLEMPVSVSLSLEKTESFKIKDGKGNFIFSLIPDKLQPASESESLLLAVLLLGAVILWLIALLNASVKLPVKFSWLILLGLYLLRYYSLNSDWLFLMQETAAFQPSLYASNEYFPNFFEYLINCTLIVFTAIFIVRTTSQLKGSKAVGYFGLSMIIMSFVLWHYLLDLTGGLIENSSIPLLTDRLFELNAYSVLAILSIGALYYSFYRFVKSGIRLYQFSHLPISTLAMIIFIGSVLFFIFEITKGSQILISGIFPLLFLGFLTYMTYKESQKISIAATILYLFIFSSVTAVNLSEFSQRKEKQERELFANQLATEKDVSTELEYELLSDKLKKDPYLLKFVTMPLRMSISDFEDAMERRFFSGYWERYEMNFNLFDTLGSSLIVDESQNFTFQELNELIKFHGQPSEVNENIFYVHNNPDQYSYIIRQRLQTEDSTVNAVLYCTLKSKKIPEEIGFPRLLISSKTNVFNSLENYSIARYHEGKLITTYGSFNYPTKDEVVYSWGKKNGFIDKDGYNHYLLKKTGEDLVMLSGKNYSYIELITSFSYLFCFYGLLLLPALFTGGNKRSSWKRTFTLAAKIQLVLIGLVFVALLGFGWGSGIFVRNQYNTYTDEMIREKMNSVNTELRSKLGTKKDFDISVDGNYMEYLLKKFSRVFVTDINIYNRSGVLMASSRPKVYNIGLISEQMNPSAFYSVSVQSKSEFIHQENIGKLNYSSAYLPFYNNEGSLLGYINLQHFGQQEDFEAQIQRFLVAIINVFMLLLAISIILAIFISNWVTAPLRLLQESFAGVKFGKYNQQIDYRKDDEIGALVKDYNQKLEELEFAAQQIAQNERESAWREMAKQVAHEIKNPLTPMKLSIQQLQRVYDPENPKSAEKLNKVAASLIEQIDALTQIANEFSNFAKMPKPNEVELDLVPLLENVIEVFRSEENITLKLESASEKVLVLADKDQMIRVFNNLIKNAVQSIPPDREGLVDIKITRKDNNYLITVSDNGSGISETERSKIFVPYFTTKSTGTGLGLAMVRQIIENHRGTIDFESLVDEGTTFTITLPVLQ